MEEANQKYQQKNTLYAYLLLDEQLRIISPNPAFTKFTNIPQDELEGFTLASCFKFNSKSLNRLSNLPSILTESFGLLKLTAYSPSMDQGSKIFRYRFLLIENGDQEEARYRLLLTKYSAMDNEFRPEVSDKHLFDLLLRELTDAIYFKDLKGRFFLTNQLHAQKYEFSYQDFIGKTDFDLFTDEHAAQAWADEQEIIRTGKPLSIEEKETHKDGSITWASTTKLPLFDESDNIVGTYGISKDITQIKEVERELRRTKKLLEEANASKDRFFSIVAHDLKSPFSAILGFTELFAEMMANKEYEEALKYSSVVHQAAKRSFLFINNLLDWASSQSGRIEFKPGNLLLKPLVKDVFSLLATQANAKGVKLKTNITQGFGVFADKDMLHAILRNLVSNAIKYSRAEDEIFIRAAQKEQNIEISVSDTGIGIPADKIPILFQLGEEVRTPGTNKEQGTGLGLIVCKEFVEKHNGSLHVKSIQNKGSVFYFSLPMHS